MQAGRRQYLDGRFLEKFAGQCLPGCLARFDAAAGQVPAGHIGVTQQQHLAGLVDDDRLHAEGEPASEPCPAVKQAREQLPQGDVIGFSFHGRGLAAIEAAVFVLAHLTDPHLGPLPRARFHELAGKRVLGVLNWRRGRRHRFSTDTIDLLLADIKAVAPDHIAVTGDLVNVGLPDEYHTGLRFLEELGEGQNVTVVPGNHDAYVRSTAHHALLNWGEYMRGDHASGDVTAEKAFPFVRRREGIALIGVSTAVPTQPFMATGRVGSHQRERLGHVLDELGKEGLFRVVLIHHPPCGQRAAHKRLTDASAVRAVLAQHGAELVICGHDHRPMVEMLPGPNSGLIPVVEAPSFAAVPEDRHWPGGYHLYRIERTADSAFPWRCTMEARGFRSGSLEIAARTERLLTAPVVSER